MLDSILTTVCGMALGFWASIMTPRDLTRKQKCWAIAATLILGCVAFPSYKRQLLKDAPSLIYSFEVEPSFVSNGETSYLLYLKNDGYIAVEDIEIKMLWAGYESRLSAAEASDLNECKKTFFSNPMLPFNCSLKRINANQIKIFEITSRKKLEAAPISKPEILISIKNGEAKKVDQKRILRP